MNYQVGISTATLYPMLTEQALLELCKRRVECVEIFINAPCELEKKFLRELKSMIDEYGVKVRSIHPFTCELESMILFTHYPRRFNDAIEYYKRFFDAAAYLGAELFVLHGNNVRNNYPFESYVKRFAKLNDVSKEFGVTVAQENVARCTGGDLGFLVGMKQQLGDDVKFILDTKQAIRKGQNPYDFVEELGDSIVHVHISDYDEVSDCKLVGTGKLDYPKFMDKLLAKGFGGSVVLELYNKGYRSLDELYQNYDYIKSVRDK
ncbi:MAG: sugar phosphate isomerase/epimerase [Oscillospiraceae bacterium]|nr:sugar phosphate isomerase/epimerase [Oscillospiraceae bacterium]